MASAVSTADGKAILPEHVHVLIAVRSHREALYASAAMNSTPFRAGAIGYSQVGGKSFGTPHLLRYLRLPRYDATSKLHQELVSASDAAHSACKAGSSEGVAVVEAEIDRLAAHLWGIAEGELAELQAYLADLRSRGIKPDEPVAEGGEDE
jgi:hypothetical protein